MRPRTDLIEHVRQLLARAGFAVSGRCDVRPVSFDVVARRDSELLIVKVLTNIDALSERIASEIKTLSQFLDAKPLLVGERSSTGGLEDDVIYYRHGIPILSAGTLEATVLERQAPLIYAAPGGFYVRLDTSILKRAREEGRASLGDLAKVAGVSRRTIALYEEGMGATVEAAMRLEEYLHESLIRPLDPFDAPREKETTAETPLPAADLSIFTALERQIFQFLQRMGYQVTPTERGPFSALSETQTPAGGSVSGTRRRTLILTGVGDSDAAVAKKARVLTSVSRIVERPGVFILKKESRRTDVEGSPVIRQKELQRLRGPEEVLTLILERRKVGEKQDDTA